MIKTLTGTSIHAALAEARRQFGDDVVLLESTPPASGVPARVRVMTDTPLAAAPSPAPAPRTAPARAGYGYAPAPARATAAAASAVYGSEVDVAVADEGIAAGPAARLDLPAITNRREAPGARTARGQIFPQNGLPSATPEWTPLQQFLDARLSSLQEGIGRVERRLDEVLIGASFRWASHPLFARLLDLGLPHARVIRLFQIAAEAGHASSGDDDALRWALAHELRRVLEVAAPRRTTGTLMLIGPAGSGKSTLALKLATNPAFFGRRRTTVIVAAPEGDPRAEGRMPAEFYRAQDIPVQCVATEREMETAIDRVRGFDQVLIDTPPFPLQESSARRALGRLHRLVSSVTPLQTHLVVNASHSLDRLSADFVSRLPLPPDAIALTGLDETDRWGRAADWLAAAGMPVQFVSAGPGAADELTAFSPGWFAEQILQLAQPVTESARG
jgi:flagellar biosynthesis protein FlhF